MKIEKNGSVVLSQGELAEVQSILERPINASGGFQTRLLQLSALFGVDHPEAPGQRSMGRTATVAAPRATASADNRPSMVPRTPALAGADLETLRAVAERIKVLREMGLHAEATALFTAHFGAVPTVTATDDDAVDVADDTDVDEEPIRAKRRASMGRTMRASAARQTADRRSAAMQARWDAFRKGKAPNPRTGEWAKGVSAAVKRAWAKSH